MKVKIRHPFAVHLTKVLDREHANGTKVTERIPDPHYGGEILDLSAADVLSHLHKLEPADDEATEWFDSYHADKAAARATTMSMGTPAGATSEERIASAVVAALVTAGVIKAK